MKSAAMWLATLMLFLLPAILPAQNVTVTQGYQYNPYTGRYSAGQATYNPYTGRTTGGYGTYNPYTGRTTAHGAAYNPYTGAGVTRNAYVNPYTGRAGGSVRWRR